MGTEGVLRLDRPHGIAVVLLALILVLLCGRAALAEAGTSPPARITVVDELDTPVAVATITGMRMR